MSNICVPSNESFDSVFVCFALDLEPYIVIAHAKGRLEKQENVVSL